MHRSELAVSIDCPLNKTPSLLLLSLKTCSTEVAQLFYKLLRAK